MSVLFNVDGMKSMSRGKIGLRGSTEICADCSATDPGWASINRGVMLCSECCSIHRSLGRHVSQVKSLRKGLWSPTLLQMVHLLNASGANSIWEHSLLDPTNAKSGRRKPQPKDPIHPVKADFIRAKYQMLAFVFRPGKDDTVLLSHDLSQQLHASVRTSNLETSLRLLSQGADPNFFHQEKGTTPLHVAAKAGQTSQTELLYVYGGDPGMPDGRGLTPQDTARMAGHQDLADRLAECVYELTDRLAYYLCSRKPDHQAGQHYIVPEMSDSLDLTDLAKTAKKKLQMLSNHLFEELAMDVYDEVDRRETETVWQSFQPAGSGTLGLDRCSAVPFLPVNPDFSSTRNQGRQKLARFNAREFATLIIDILADAKKRQAPVTSSLILPPETRSVRGSLPAHPGKRRSDGSDDEPLYDSVASDEDYITTEQIAMLARQTAAAKLELDSVKAAAVRGSRLSGEGRGNRLSGGEGGGGGGAAVNGVFSSVEENLKRQLATSETKINKMAAEIQQLQSTVSGLLAENLTLRATVQRAGLALPNGHPPAPAPASTAPAPRGTQRPTSMYEPREGLQPPRATAHLGFKWDTKRDRESALMSTYDSPSSLKRPVAAHSLHGGSSGGMPQAEEVVLRTDQVTKRIQELWAAMQDPGSACSADPCAGFAPCADRIRCAVSDLAAVFPSLPSDPAVGAALRQLADNTARLQAECAALQPGGAGEGDRSTYLQHVRQCAYDIAKATKQLVQLFQS